jgi:uncharacterized protein (TIGR02001 family)
MARGAKQKGIAMKFWKMALCAAAASLALGGAANAQDEGGGDETSFSFNVGAATDYVFRGVSQTDGAQVFGGVDVSSGAIYGGAWVSNVDFNDSTNAEIDLYVGVKPTAGPVTFDLGVIYYGYAGEPTGSSYEYTEIKAAASMPIGPATVGVATYYSPDFFAGTGEAVYIEANGSWAINDKWSVGGALGEQSFASGLGEYTTWNVGVSWAPIDHIFLDLRYADSDLGCSTFCGERVFLTLKSTFP